MLVSGIISKSIIVHIALVHLKDEVWLMQRLFIRVFLFYFELFPKTMTVISRFINVWVLSWWKSSIVKVFVLMVSEMRWILTMLLLMTWYITVIRLRWKIWFVTWNRCWRFVLALWNIVFEKKAKYRKKKNDI